MGNAMNNHRNTESYTKRLEDFANEILIVCPSCGKQALVRNSNLEKFEPSKVKLICATCGYSKSLEHKPYIEFTSNNNPILVNILVYGGPIDPYFQTRLWLTTSVDGNDLWAFNLNHLNFLESLVESKLRERDIADMQNKSLGSRLPRWMTSKKNREKVLKAIRTLKTTQ